MVQVDKNSSSLVEVSNLFEKLEEILSYTGEMVLTWSDS